MVYEFISAIMKLVIRVIPQFELGVSLGKWVSK